ncbi:hypothetical protein ES703_39927 [subsurface metagenome]
MKIMKSWKELKPWKKLEEYIADYLEGWVRKKKKHFGDSVWDLEGDGYKGGAKHFKRFSIHTISDKENRKYKDDVVLFTKEKRKHYVPENIRVTINLKQFDYLLHCKKRAEKMPKKVIKNKIDLRSELKFQINIIKKAIQVINKIFKKLEKR